VETGTLYSDTHDGDSGRSSQAFPTPSLEASQTPEVRNLGPQTSICSSFHQRTLPATRNKVSVFYSLAPPNRRTDRVCQPGVGPVPPALRKWTCCPWQSSNTTIMSTPLPNSLCSCLIPDDFLAWASNPDKTPPV